MPPVCVHGSSFHEEVGVTTDTVVMKQSSLPCENARFSPQLHPGTSRCPQNWAPLYRVQVAEVFLGRRPMFSSLLVFPANFCCCDNSPELSGSRFYFGSPEEHRVQASSTVADVYDSYIFCVYLLLCPSFFCFVSSCPSPVAFSRGLLLTGDGIVVAVHGATFPPLQVFHFPNEHHWVQHMAVVSIALLASPRFWRGRVAVRIVSSSGREAKELQWWRHRNLFPSVCGGVLERGQAAYVVLRVALSS